MSSTEVAPDDQSPPIASATGDALGDDDGAEGNIGWIRAIATGLVVLLIGFGAGAGGANAILTKALGLTRDARQWLATALFLAVIIVLAGALRWLQGRGWI